MDAYTEYQMALNRWARGRDWCVAKVGRKWRMILQDGYPLYRTKSGAYDAATALVKELGLRAPEGK